MARWATVGGPCTLAWQGLLAITSCPGGRRLPRAAGGVHYHGWRAEPAARVHARCAAGSHPTALLANWIQTLTAHVFLNQQYGAVALYFEPRFDAASRAAKLVFAVRHHVTIT